MSGNGDTTVAVDGVRTGNAPVSAAAQPLAKAADGAGSCWGMWFAAALHAEATRVRGCVGAAANATGNG